jgi:Translation initiation factor IF-3, N-terminal domain
MRSCIILPHHVTCRRSNGKCTHGRIAPPPFTACRAREVRTIDASRENIGVLPFREVLRMADEDDMDVILLNAEAEPPLVRIVNLSKYKYELDMDNKTSSRKQREKKQTLKEIHVSARVHTHDLQARSSPGRHAVWLLLHPRSLHLLVSLLLSGFMAQDENVSQSDVAICTCRRQPQA